MMVTESQIELVQTSWAKLVPRGEEAGALFYDNLFELNPGLQSLFKSDIQEQGAKLVQMIDVGSARPQPH